MSSSKVQSRPSPRNKRQGSTGAANRPYARPIPGAGSSKSFGPGSSPSKSHSISHVSSPSSVGYLSPAGSSPEKRASTWSRSHSTTSIGSMGMAGGGGGQSSGLMGPPPIPIPNQLQYPYQTPTPSHYFSSPTSSLSISPDMQFGFYPQSFPSNPSFIDPSAYAPTEFSDWTFDQDDATTMSQTDMSESIDPRLSFSDMDSEAMYNPSIPPSDVTSSPSKAGSTSTKTPRPPNAWILYRSDKLKAIAAGDVIPGLDSVMAELNPSGSSASPSTEDNDDDSVKPARKSRHRPPKKGAKPPTEGLLSLGKGKLGRGLPQADISKMISMLWKRESATIRDRYEHMALVKKREHQAKYPDYKFQPLRKADKIKMREEKEQAKEAAKRAKELQRSGGRSRRGKTKNRFSPTATTKSRSSATTSVADYAPSLIQESSNESGWATGSQNVETPFIDTSSLPLEHRLRSYPFPMPPGSLPSMRPEDHAGHNPYSESPFIESEGFDLPLPLPDKQHTGFQGHDTFDGPPQMPPPHTHPAIPYARPVEHSHGPYQPLDAAVLEAQAPTPSQQMQLLGPASIIDVPATSHYQMPDDVSSELSPHPTSSPPTRVPGTRSRPQSRPATKGTRRKSAVPKAKADKLAALWSVMEEGDGPVPGSADMGKAAEAMEADEQEAEAKSAAEGSSAAAENTVGTDATAQFHSTSMLPVNEEYYCHTGPWTLVMPDGQALQHEFTPDQGPSQPMTVGEWYDLNADLTQFILAMPADPSEPSIDTGMMSTTNTEALPVSGPSGSVVGQTSQFVIPQEGIAPQSMMQLQSTTIDERGPFLSQAPILSPMDAEWTGRSTLSPTNATGNRWASNNRVPSYSVTASDGSSLPFTVVPRHISGFSSLDDGQWAGNDRSLSYALHPMGEGLIPEMDISEDLFWSSFEMAAPAPPPTMMSTNAPDAVPMTTHSGTAGSIGSTSTAVSVTGDVIEDIQEEEEGADDGASGSGVLLTPVTEDPEGVDGREKELGGEENMALDTHGELQRTKSVESEGMESLESDTPKMSMRSGRTVNTTMRGTKRGRAVGRRYGDA